MKEVLNTIEALTNSAAIAMLVICAGIVVYIKWRHKDGPE